MSDQLWPAIGVLREAMRTGADQARNCKSGTNGSACSECIKAADVLDAAVELGLDALAELPRNTREAVERLVPVLGETPGEAMVFMVLAWLADHPHYSAHLNMGLELVPLE